MAERLGMDPERVLALSARMTQQSSVLDNAVDRVEAAARASLNPLSYGIQPGGLVIAPWSIAGTQVAAALVRQATADAGMLSSRLIAEALQQYVASSEAGGKAFAVPRVRDALLEAALLDPSALDGLTPEQVAAWWASLSPADRDRLIAANPLTIGNTEGIPYADRDRANRLALEELLADPDLPQSQRDTLEAVRDALAFAEDGGDTVQLVILDFPEGADPRAAIAFGDLDTADSIGVLVPGMDNTVVKDMTSLSTAARNLYEAQKDLAARSGAGGSPAVIAWMGYQTPGAPLNPAVLQEGRAQDGAVYLNRTLAGLDAVRGEGPRVTVFAHSYGSRVATYALSTGGSADSLVMFGSPGVAEPVTSVDDLAVPAGEVYVTRAEKDWVAPLGLTGSGNLDPLTPSFGAETLSSDGSGTLEGVDDHGLLLDTASNGEKQGYLDRGTQSLDQFAKIGLAG